ncbi:pectinesterase family protein [uncultured Treponema sp.]|uniref:pectinesterase family protein n=1 Tax=uncultured Treponema sp. TaxID=162155 RepID=UPI0025E3E28B|nr:pectinesterase family protein [uncultured Treponema sp.]
MKKLLSIIASAVLLFSAASCSFLDTAESSETQTETEYGRIAFTTSDDNLTEIVLKGTDSSGAEKTFGSWADNADLKNAESVKVPVGIWNFTLTLKKDGVLYTGTTSAVIIAKGETANVVFEMKVSGTEVEGTFSFSGYKWNLDENATATLSSDEKILTVKPAKGCAPIVMDSSELAALYEKYPEGFAVTAAIRPIAFGSTKGGLWSSNEGPDLGIASHYSDSAFYDFTLNWNGRTQLGTKANAKGKQFGSLITDNSGTIFKQKVLDEPYVLRMEYSSDGNISGYVNGIAQAKSGSATLDVSGATRSATEGSYAIVTGQGDSFELYSFKVSALDEGKAGILLTTNNEEISVLSDGAISPTKYVFLNAVSYETRVGSDAVTFNAKAFADNGDALDVTVSGSDDSIATVTVNENSFEINPLAAGPCVVTVKAGEVTRTIDVTVKAALGYKDTEYDDSALYPVPAATGIYEDERLSIIFDETPVLGEGDIEIYKKSDLEHPVSKISVNLGNSYNISDGTNSQLYTLKNFNVQIDGNKLLIIPADGVLENNTEYVIGMAEGVITGKIGGKEFTGFDPAIARWSFTTRESKPSVTSEILVGTSASANFRSVQSALRAVSSDATIYIEPGVYHEILMYRKSYNIKIEGKGTEKYGTDVVIRGINCNEYNGSTATRAVFSFKSTAADLTLKNLTLQNAMDRNTMISGTSSQSESLYFDNANGHFAANNCSFKGYQDTLLLNTGRSWFYDCYVEGDTDFIWGASDVVLLEKCKIVQLDTSADKNKTSGSYVFETRVSKDAVSTPTVGKGYVLFNTELVSNHKTSYLARRASGAGAAGSNYYDQSAFINVTQTGDAANLKGAFYVGNEPIYIEKDSSGNQNVGIKVYGGNLNKEFSTAWEGTITDEVYNKEYNGRNTIINRVYKKTGSYANADVIWDLSELESYFNAEKDNSTLDEIETIEGANGVYDIEALAKAATTGSSSFTDKDKSALTDGSSDDGYMSWTGMLNFGAGYGVYTTNGTITLKVAGASVISWTSSTYSKGTVTVTDSSSNKVLDAVSTKVGTNTGTVSFLYEKEEATTLTLTFSGDNYIGNVKVSPLDGETNEVASVTVNGAGNMVVGGETTFTATVSAAYLSTDTSVTWTSDNGSVATVDASGKVVAVGTGTATITATSVTTPSVSGSKTVNVKADEAWPVYGQSYEYDLTAVTSATYESDDSFLKARALAPNSSHGLQFKNTTNTMSLKVSSACDIIFTCCEYGNGATVAVVDSEGNTVETGITEMKVAADKTPQTFSYTGSATTLNFTFTGECYIHKIVITPKIDVTYNLTAVTSATYESDDGHLKAVALAPNSSHGLQFKNTTNTMSIDVPAKCDITFTCCEYGNGATVAVVDSEGKNVETGITQMKVDADKTTQTFSYTGTATTLNFTFTGECYIHSVNVKSVD